MGDINKKQDLKSAGTHVGTAGVDAARRSAEPSHSGDQAAVDTMPREAEAVQRSEHGVSEAMQRGAQAARDAAQRTAEAIKQNGRAAGEAMRKGSDITAEAARQRTQAGAEAVRQINDVTTDTVRETLRRSAEAMAEGQRQIAQETAQAYEEASRKLALTARSTSDDVSRLFTLPKAAEGGLRDMQQGVTDLVEGIVQTNLRATQELFRLSSPVVLIELQQRFVREYLDTLMQGTVSLVRAVHHTAGQTLRPLEEHVEQRQQAQRHQAAAE